MLSVGPGFVEDIRWMMDVLVLSLFRDSLCGGEGQHAGRAEEEEPTEYWAHLSPCSLTSLFCQRLLPPLHRSILSLLPYGLLLCIFPTSVCLFLLINLSFHASSYLFFPLSVFLLLPFLYYLVFSSYTSSASVPFCSFPAFFPLPFLLPCLPFFLRALSISTSPTPPSPFCGWFLPCVGCNSLWDRWAGAAIIPSPAAFDGSPSSAAGVILRASGC